MDPERWRQIDAVLQAALELEEGDRRAYLDEVCAGDAELRAEVDALLGFESKADPFMAVPAVEAAGVEVDEPMGAGKVVGPYRIEGLLGEGGMGAVYRARDERLGRVVAIKVVSTGGDAGLVRRLAQEARLASSLNHPNIVTVYDVGRVDGVPYVVTELVEGEVLRAKMAAGIGVEEAVDVARQVASALSAAHAAGIVHRDVKPENVIVRADGLVKVLDFGIAKRAATASSEEAETDVQTAAGVMVGTVAYMSPEQARAGAVDGRTDVWSLGVMLYEMMAGHRPFRGPTRVDVLAAVLGAEPEPVAAMPEGLVEVVERALRKRADERYATAGEMAEALEAFKRELKGGKPGGVGGATTNERRSTTAENEARTEERTAAPTNLPEEREVLIGREREMRAIVDELRQTRLLTVTGPGGTGKTRLATDAARALLHEFEDGVFFVELAAVRDPGLVASAVAQALGVKEAAGATLDETLAEALGERELLLVLDNFEQVVAAAPLVARLLASAPRVKALVTSRERLHVTVERELALSPLALPPAGMATGEELAGYGSVALFVERARAVRPGFELSEASAAAVVEICRRLDGLPLAIELATARLRILAPDALLARLDKQLKLLTGGARDLPERQQTMRAAIAWSYDLLSDDEQRLFEQLSVFSGGWTLSAAEAVAPDADVLDLLTQLADKSLVVVEERDEEMRYRILETIRQFAAEKLAEAGDAARMRAAHAEWVVEFAEAGVPEFNRPGAPRWLARLDREQENVRAALEWSAGERGAPELALRLSAAVGQFWWVRGRWSEGRSWLERALATDREPSTGRAAALYWMGKLARAQSSYERARELIAESLSLCREIGDRPGTARALGELGLIVFFTGDLDAAQALMRESLALHEEVGDDWGRAQAIGMLSRVAHERNDLDTAEAAMVEALAIYRGIGDRRMVATQLFNLGNLTVRRRAYAEAAELLEESLELAREFDDRPLAARVVHFLGNVAGGRGDYALAGRQRAEAAREYLAMGDRHMIAVLFEDVISEALARGLTERAARLLGAMLSLEDSGELPPASPADAEELGFLVSVRKALGEAEAEGAMAKGRRLTLDVALKLAFSD